MAVIQPFLFTLKMESVTKITIFGLNMMVKIGLEKNIFEIPIHVGDMLFVVLGKNLPTYEARKNSFLHEGISKLHTVPNNSYRF